MARSGRLLELAYLLHGRRSLTVRDIADRLEISVRTAYRDLAELDASKILLETNAKSGYYLSELDILLLALANNMGHCQSHFNSIDESRICLERMLAIFFLSDSTVLLTKDEYVFFYINIHLGISRAPIFAAAA